MKEMFGEAPEKAGWTYLVPYFGSSAPLVRQFKKIEGLELVSELERGVRGRGTSRCTFRILAVVWGLVWAVLVVGAVHFVSTH